jgi:threonine dehydratase
VVSFAAIQEARARIASIAQRTPVMTSRGFDREAGVQAFLKCENLQRGGAFKIRGASNLIFGLSPEELGRGVVAFSSGNHAQAVAIAARAMGTHATLVMPEDAPKFKMEATRAQGPTVITYNRFADDREALGRRVAAETGAILVPPYDDERIIAGQGTAGVELVEDVRDLDAVAVCVGGGGLISGCAVAATALNPSIRVFGVEPELANDTWQSFRKGERVGIAPPETIADGLRSPMPGALTFPIMQKLVEDIVLVSEDEIRATVRFLLLRMKILVEPSGAVAAAAVLFHKLPPGLGRVGVILSGGNIDADQIAAIVNEC